jgi:hypothetical protein
MFSEVAETPLHPKQTPVDKPKAKKIKKIDHEVQEASNFASSMLMMCARNMNKN